MDTSTSYGGKTFKCLAIFNPSHWMINEPLKPPLALASLGSWMLCVRVLCGCVRPFLFSPGKSLMQIVPLRLVWVGQQMASAFLHGADALYSLLFTRHRLLMDHFFFVPFWCFRIITGEIVSLLFSTRENRSPIRILDFVLLRPFAFYINDYIGVKHIMQANNAFRVCNYYVEGGNESLFCIQKTR